MKKTDIGKSNTYAQGGQENKSQVVKTPFGELTVPCFVRVPKMSASKRTWAVWHKRFIESPKLLDIQKKRLVSCLNVKGLKSKMMLQPIKT